MAALAMNAGVGPQSGWAGAPPFTDVYLGSQPDALLHPRQAVARITAQHLIRGAQQGGLGSMEYLLAFDGYGEEESLWFSDSAIVE